LISARNNNVYGTYSVNFHPLFMERLAEQNQRDLLRFHGGVTRQMRNLGISGLSSRQPLSLNTASLIGYTQGCARFYNQDIDEMVRILTELVGRGEPEEGVILIGNQPYLTGIPSSLRFKANALTIVRTSGATPVVIRSALIRNLDARWQ
jgi:hypothetical protein